jgi:hypothetical protein
MAVNSAPVSKGPSRKQAMILVGAGIVLSAGGCATFMNQLYNALRPGGGSGNAALEIIGAGTFVTGVILFLTGFVELVQAIRGGHSAMTNETQAPQPWPTRKLVRTLLGAGIVLGAGGAPSLDGSLNLLGIIGVSAFVVGVVLFLMGLVALLIRRRRAMRGGGQRDDK